MTIYDKELQNNTRLYPPTPVYKNIYIEQAAFQIPGVKPAARVDHGIGTAWEFTDGTDDTLFAQVRLPLDIGSYDFTIGIGWSTPTANAGNCYWQVEYLMVAPGGDVTAAADDTLSGLFAASSTANGLVNSQIGNITPIANKNLIMLRIKRRADDNSDTLGEDCYLHGVAIRYVSTTRGQDF